jgi:hypothetical protein
MADSGTIEQRLDRRDQDRVIGADDLVHAYIRKVTTRQARQAAHLPVKCSVSMLARP